MKEQFSDVLNILFIGKERWKCGQKFICFFNRTL